MESPSACRASTPARRTITPCSSPNTTLPARPALRNSPPRPHISNSAPGPLSLPTPPRAGGRGLSRRLRKGRAGLVAVPSPPRRSLPSHRSQPWRRHGSPKGGVGRARAAQRPRMAADGSGRDETHSLSAMVSAGREGRARARRALSSFARASEALRVGRTPGSNVLRCA